jgi:hypothetical protein
MVSANGAAPAAAQVYVIDEKQRKSVGLNLFELVDSGLELRVDREPVAVRTHLALAERILLD